MLHAGNLFFSCCSKCIAVVGCATCHMIAWCQPATTQVRSVDHPSASTTPSGNANVPGRSLCRTPSKHHKITSSALFLAVICHRRGAALTALSQPLWRSANTDHPGHLFAVQTGARAFVHRYNICFSIFAQKLFIEWPEMNPVSPYRKWDKGLDRCLESKKLSGWDGMHGLKQKHSLLRL